MSNEHGGKREGSGRKLKYNEPTKALRVPESRILEIKEFLSRTPKKSELKDFREVDPRTHVQIPVATERVQAGFPSPVQDYVDKKLDLNEHLIKNVNATYIAKIDSLSMIGIGLDVNDEIVIDRSLTAKHRDIVVAKIDNELTVKRLMIENDVIWLKAENPDFPDIHFKEGQEFSIWGVVTKVIKSFR